MSKPIEDMLSDYFSRPLLIGIGVVCAFAALFLLITYDVGVLLRALAFLCFLFILGLYALLAPYRPNQRPLAPSWRDVVDSHIGDDPMLHERRQGTNDAWQALTAGVEAEIEKANADIWEAEKTAREQPLHRGDDPDLIRAAQQGKHETAKQLIALGARLDAEGLGRAYPTALMAAIRSGSKETVEVLVAAGADVNRGVIHGDGRDYGWDDAWETPFKAAVSCGNHDILRVLLARGARVPDLRSPFDAGVEEGILMLFEIGEDALARDFGRAAAGVELSQPGTELLQRARRLGSILAAFAEWFAAAGDGPSAKRLCEWKIKRWIAGQVQEDWERLPMEMAACLRTLASVCELEGRAREAVVHCRTALRVWRINDLKDVPPIIASFVLGSGHRPLTETELRRTVVQVPDPWRGELATAIRICEAMLGRLGMQEEQRCVAAMLPLHGIA